MAASIEGNGRSVPKPDHAIILGLVHEGSSVLDLGCGGGDLLSALVREKKVKGQGIEIDDQCLFDCVAKELSVFQDDIDTGLPEYSDYAFDYVILNQCFQQVKKPDIVLAEALRVGRRVIIGMPNFAHISARIQIFFRGRTPVTPSLPYEWHNTPNLHFLSILDFIEYCRKRAITIEQARFLGTQREVRFLPNLFAQTGIFLISRIAGNISS
jgi:methionine biosynthesis protein MetW